VVRGSPVLRPFVVRRRIFDPRFHVCPTSPPVSRYRRTCSAPNRFSPSLIGPSVSAAVPIMRERTGVTSRRTSIPLLRGRAPLLLPAPGPGNRPVLLRVRTADLLRVHDPGACRDPLPRALGQAAGDPEGDARRRACGDRR